MLIFLTWCGKGKHTPKVPWGVSVGGSRKGLFVGFGFALSDSEVGRAEEETSGEGWRWS